MFLLEVGFVISVYFGFRISEQHEKKRARKSKRLVFRERSKSKDSGHKEMVPQKSVEPRNLPSNSQTEEYDFIQKKKQVDHDLKASIVHLGLATVRQFLYPPIAPLYLGILTYNSFSLFRRAEKSLIEEKKFGMDVLTTIGTFASLAFGQFFAMGVGTFFYFLSDKIIIITQRHSKELLTNTFGQLPRMVWCLRDQVEIETPLEDVRVNDIVVVTIGLMIPIDGIIIDGSAMIDQHALTGESQPAEKSIGEKVFATTVVISGKILVKTEQTGQETTVAKIDNILKHSANFKNKAQLLGEQWADKGALPFLGLFLLTTPVFGATAGLVVLTGYFGGRIRVLAPLGTFAHLKWASQKGILVKDGRALESLIRVDTILFDKTGTLTNKALSVVKIIVCDDYGEDELLTYAAAAESKMTHPIAKAILAKAVHFTLPKLDDSKYQVGFGITVSIENRLIKVGSARFMKMEGISLPEKIEQAMTDVHIQGHSVVLVAVNNKLIGAIELQSVVRSEVKQLIANLRQHGIKHIAIVSGDHKQPTKKLAEQLGMDDYFYDILPEEKANIVEKLQKEGKSVCFVGDGINDAIAMKKATVSISLMGASSIATDVAEVLLMDGTLYHLTDLFEIAKKLETNLQTSLGMSVVPTAINFTGVFFFHLGYTTAIVIKNMAFFVGLGNAMLPLRKIEKLEKESVDCVEVRREHVS
ncbi:MAG: heavy metal translocating P-type ATPase [Candidatus Parabeggiatoa sp.]|nr:heavy metal translocating P-type ATPase [Candidatus Parabeggiatoa sp.]